MTEKKTCWICDLGCSRIFTCKRNLLRHKETMHLTDSTPAFQCSECLKIFKRKDELSNHIARIHHTNSNVFECAYCPKKFYFKKSIIQHIDVAHISGWSARENYGKCSKEPFICAICGVIVSRKSSLKRHITTKHALDKVPKFECYYCGKTVSRKYNIARHIESFHANGMVKLYNCSQCSASFKQKRSLNRHVRVCDAGNYTKSRIFKSTELKCLKCGEDFNSRKILIEHYQQNHNIVMEYVNIRFQSYDKFVEWKKDMQRQTVTQFTTRNRYVCRTTSRVNVVYTCHRSRTYHSRVSDAERKRSLKKTGYKGLGGFCPAQIVVIQFADGVCCVQFQKTHVGHEIGTEAELKHIFLERDERLSIAARIQEGVPWRQILQESTSVVEKSSRLSKLKKKDLHNVAASCKQGCLASNNSVYKAVHVGIDNLINVDDLIKEHENQILYLKKQNEADQTFGRFTNEDFVAVLMNREQEESVKRYGSKLVAFDETNCNDFFVHSLLVADVDCECMPVAYALSNRNDRVIVDTFLECVRNQVGVIESRTLIAPKQSTYYTSWSTTMAVPEFYFFCIWHVREDWKRHTNQIVNKTARQTICAKLDELAHELNPTTFEEMLNAFLSSSKVEEHFVEYFRQNYAYNSQHWAYCHRQVADINVNVHLDDFHQLKRSIAGGRKVKNLTQCLMYLLKYSTVVEKINRQKQILGEMTNKLAYLKQRHQTASMQYEDKTTIGVVAPVDARTFLVGFLQDSNDSLQEMFTVTKIEPKECSIYGADVSCRLMCELCNMCFHEYRCTCADWTVWNNMCKHIHSVGIHRHSLMDSYEHSIIENVPVYESDTSQVQDDDNIDYTYKEENDDTLKTIKERCRVEFEQALAEAGTIEQANLFYENFVVPMTTIVVNQK